MSDLERDAEELGRQIWPDRRTAPTPAPHRGRGWWWAAHLVRRSRLAALAAGVISLLTIGSVVFAGTVTVRTLVHETQSSPSGGASGGGVTGPTSATTATGTAWPSGGPGGGGAGTRPAGPTATAGGVPATPGPTATPPFTVQPGPPSTPSPSGVSITITYQSSNGRTVFVSLGETIYVELTPTRVGLHWTGPHTANASVVEVLSSTANRNGSAQGTFVAAHRGQTTLSAAESSCSSTDPNCPGPAMPWQVRIQVG